MSSDQEESGKERRFDRDVNRDRFEDMSEQELKREIRSMKSSIDPEIDQEVILSADTCLELFTAFRVAEDRGIRIYNIDGASIWGKKIYHTFGKKNHKPESEYPVVEVDTEDGRIELSKEHPNNCDCNWVLQNREQEDSLPADRVPEQEEAKWYPRVGISCMREEIEESLHSLTATYYYNQSYGNREEFFEEIPAKEK